MKRYFDADIIDFLDPMMDISIHDSDHNDKHVNADQSSTLTEANLPSHKVKYVEDGQERWYKVIISSL